MYHKELLVAVIVSLVHADCEEVNSNVSDWGQHPQSSFCVNNIFQSLSKSIKLS